VYFKQVLTANTDQWLAGARVRLVFGSSQQQTLDECVQSALTVV